MILPDSIRERHRRALEHIARLEARIDRLSHYQRLIRDGNPLGFLRVSDAARLIGISRPTLDRLIGQRAVREVVIFPGETDAPRMVCVADLVCLPAVVLRSGDNAETRQTRRRYYDA